MVKFIATNQETGRVVLGVGIVRGNIDRLVSGLPIHFNKEQLKLTEMKIDDVVVFFGETEQAIEEEFRKHGVIDATTKIQTDNLPEH